MKTMRTGGSLEVCQLFFQSENDELELPGTKNCQKLMNGIRRVNGGSFKFDRISACFRVFQLDSCHQ